MDISYEEWEDKYQPIKDANGDIIFFETYGEDIDIISKTDQEYIWTWVDGGDYSGYVAGVHFVNRMNYIICSVPWENEDLYVDNYVMTLCDMDEHVWVDHKRYDGTPVEICSECEMDRADYVELNS